MSQQQLTAEIIARSYNQTWITAKTEWLLEEIYEADNPDTCLCGHFPIREICVLRNKINKNVAIVGNCCVKKFIGLPSDKIFQAIKRIRKDAEKSLNTEAIQYALNRHWVSEWEHDFYTDIMKKRLLSPKQAAKKADINAKFLRNMERKK
jgi:hypothetical protein